MSKPLPSKVDLRDKLPPITDQGGLGSSSAIAAAAMATAQTEDQPFVYYESREMDDMTQAAGNAGMSRQLIYVLLTDLKPQERADIFAELRGLFCQYCGTDELPCHCQNDE